MLHWLNLPPTLEREFLVFGSSAQLTLRGADRTRLDAAADAIERMAAAHHRQWHPWEDSSLSAINSAVARGEAAPIPASIERLIEQSMPLVADSRGMFDPGAGAMIARWGFHTSQWASPGPQVAPALTSHWAANRPSLLDVHISNHMLTAPSRELQLDFNAVAEGATMADAMGLLRQHRVPHGLLSFGGDVGALGDAGGRPWKVALRDPDGGVLGFVELADGEVLFASGSYSKYRESGGVRRPHIVDPRSGEPVSGTLASAVLDDRPLRADAAATALMVAGSAQWQALARDLDLACALIIGADNTLYMTPGMQRRLRLLRQPTRIALAATIPRQHCASGALQSD